MNIMIMFIPISVSFMMLNHPLSMGFNILMLTITISLTTGMMNSTFWFSYILFLVLIGGLLILFIYMTSIASNEKFKFSTKLMMINLMMIMMSYMMLNNLNFKTKIKDMNQYMDSMNLSMTNLKYFSPSLTIILISAMMYLLITLIMIVKITKKEKGPIRQK
uniref:NADH-ubiquinone oxidoreductase chain 6 n=1 Tax=Colasposoma dauricum TaxID=1301243 RepID=A0A7U1AQA0_9CUCU|nr:NADH dehydrogenase subunit 6 [Colasposoma dauricum]AST15011.1 NADH dehydrogenase subunit 6 [Colasposoma dauricum]QQY84945.1 NADH dehydrogenase subunit 6 [Colasposoma dauricum]